MINYQIFKQRFQHHPRHAIIGCTLFLIGLNFMLNDTYFFWPPYMARVLNDDVLGFIAMAVGLWLVHWAFQAKRSVTVNRNLLMAASAFFAFDGTAEFMHGLVAGRPHMFTAAILNFCLLCIVLIMARTGKKTK